jgi:hypothetical protein
VPHDLSPRPLILTSKHLQTLTHRSSHRAAPGNFFLCRA